MSRRSKRAPKVQPPSQIKPFHPGRLSPYRNSYGRRGWTGRTCIYCGNEIWWDEIRRGGAEDRLPQEPTIVGIRHAEAHVWCRLKAILGKRARHHRLTKTKPPRKRNWR